MASVHLVPLFLFTYLTDTWRNTNHIHVLFFEKGLDTITIKISF
jgi:hypothetical protein